MNEWNNEKTLRPLRGRIWVTKGEPGKGGKNLCARLANVLAMGWDPAEWL